MVTRIKPGQPANRCRCLQVIVIAIVVVVGLHWASDEVFAHGRNLLVADNAWQPNPEALRKEIAPLGAIMRMALFLVAGFSLFCLWGLLFQIGTADTDERLLQGDTRAIWDGFLPNADELPVEGD